MHIRHLSMQHTSQRWCVRQGRMSNEWELRSDVCERKRVVAVVKRGNLSHSTDSLAVMPMKNRSMPVMQAMQGCCAPLTSYTTVMQTASISSHFSDIAHSARHLHYVSVWLCSCGNQRLGITLPLFRLVGLKPREAAAPQESNKMANR